ncbi:hypothetical protein FJV76_25010 [Mesorhizobium sp. WSM4303]|uniref:hypothetical protein n=1 Tax=unclassified Mesorhizobium TaxID=325217 RepID=UPI00115CF713|nr:MULTISPECIES: hypothetical protein [unclassified Mesorhizobium]TRC98420.1 hypothetical protein FJV77_08230 [Mesorhizobium sp. WSM4306]TRC99050.1 hypothetical protein FJV76_25010 [Mesorhizobium sp. WSM4303]
MKLLAKVLAASACLAGCSAEADDGSTYTLYRGSLTGEMRIHVATFNATESEAYNHENCQIAADLFQAQPGVLVRSWCEKGRYLTAPVVLLRVR